MKSVSTRLKGLALSLIISVLIGFFGIGLASSSVVACELPQDTFLGLPPWYKYLEGESVSVRDISNPDSPSTLCQPVVEADPGKSIPTQDFLLIVAAVIEMLIRISGLAAFAFLVYGGFMYLTSSGEAENTKKAGQTLLNAAIGLAIAISATALLNFVARQF